MFEYKAKLIKVIDGDTIDAEIDLGFDVFVKKRVRLYQIDAPETRTRDKKEKILGKQAKKRLLEILNLNKGIFVLKSYGIGKFGRCLGEIFVNNASVNKILLNEGHAAEYKE